MEKTKQQFDRRWLVIIAVSVPLIAVSIDNTVLDLALPTIAVAFETSAAQLQWIINAYVLAAAAPLLVFGALSDRIGRRRLMITGLIVFALSSVVAVLSPNSMVLIACRATLGIGAAMMLPSTLSIVRATFTTPKELMLAIAIWSGIMGAGNAIGPIVGGTLLHFFDWHAVFLMNLPFAAIGILLVWLWIKESRGHNAPMPDLWGSLLSTGALFAIVYGVIKSGELGWGSQTVWAFLLGGLIIGAVFVWWENRSRNPMIPFVVFKNRSFASACVGMTIMSLAFMGSVFFISQFLQSIQGNSPLKAAVMMLPLVPAMLIATSIAPKLAQKFGVKWILATGMLICIASLFYYSQVVAVDSSYWLFLIALVSISFGLGLAFSMAANAIMGSLSADRAGAGSALNETAQQLGGAFGVAILGALMNSIYRADVTKIPFFGSLGTEFQAIIISSVQNAHIYAEKLREMGFDDMAADIVRFADQAFVSGMNSAMLVGSFIGLVALVIIVIFMPRNIQYYKESSVAPETEIVVSS